MRAGTSNLRQLEDLRAARSGRSRPRSGNADVEALADAVVERLRPPEADPADDLAALSERLGCDLASVTRRGDELEIELADGRRIDLGPVERALSPARVEAAVYRVTGRALDLGTKREWLGYAERLHRCARIVETVSEAEETLSWVRAALRWPTQFADLLDNPTWRREAYLGAGNENPDASGPAAWREGERLAVDVERLLAHLLLRGGLRFTLPDLARRLGRAGFTRRRLSFADKGREVRCRAWCAPIGILDTDRPEPGEGETLCDS